MRPFHLSITINAPREKVWHTLWDDASLRDWASIIDEGTYMVGELKEGAEVQFISAEGGYGVTSLVEKLIPHELVVFRQVQDTQEFGAAEREAQWTGSTETYTLSEHEGITTLEFTTDVPEGLEEIMADRYPKAYARVKELAEH
jgi:uncharacterized protein YndB with AHSA1/START domain